MSIDSPRGVVYLVGAGPGDPELLTLRGRSLLSSCDAVVYDYLAEETLLDFAPARAARVYVGKTGAHKGASTRQERIHEILIARASRGERVVRLKGGDPFVFGRGGEEAEVLRAHAIPFEVVPGVSSAIAAAAYAGIPITHRDINTCAAIITGHEDPNRPEGRTDWSALAGVASRGGTLIILMGVKHIRRNMDFLAHNGVPRETPVAVVRWGTKPQQETVVATLDTIADACEARSLRPPAVVIVGRVVEKRRTMRWFEDRPLHARTVLLTRSAVSSEALSTHVRALGGVPWVAPCVGFEAHNTQETDSTLRALASFDWVAFTSANTVRFVAERISALHFDARLFAQTRVACVGRKTAQTLWDMLRIRADLIPDKHTAQALAEAFLTDPLALPQRVWLPQSDLARDTLCVALRDAGVEVEVLSVYRTGQGGEWSKHTRDYLTHGAVDAALFASPSAIRNMQIRLGSQEAFQNVLAHAYIVCIGPVTAKAARESGLVVGAVADPHTEEGMMCALVNHFKPEK